MRSRYLWLSAVALAAVLCLGLVACGSSNNKSSTTSKSGGKINGAGATFPQPVYSEWAARFKDQSGTVVNYQPVGSGAGLAQFTAGTVDFGASDPPLKPDEQKAASTKTPALQFPTVLGAVTVSYNLSGVKAGLKLDGPTTANIFLGKITKWNDPAIKSLNPGVSLPSSSITVIHRSDESGTTKLYTTYLGDYSKAWLNGPGVDKTVKWPTGTGAKGNDGVAAAVKQTQGSIGYVEEAFALQNNFTTADMKNKAGNYVAPTLKSTAAAGANVTVPANLGFDSINAPGADSYPIAAGTFLLVHQDGCKAGLSKSTAKNIKAWLDYALGAGQQVAPKLQYAPLPSSILSKTKAQVGTLTCNGKSL